MRVYASDGVTMRLELFEHILRVALVKDGIPLLPTWSVCPNGGDVPLEGREKLSVEGFTLAETEVTENDTEIDFMLSGVGFRIEKKNFRITAKTDRGLLYRDRSGLAYNFAGKLGRGSAHLSCRFEGQRIFGLGDKGGPVDKSDRRFTIAATEWKLRYRQMDELLSQIWMHSCLSEVSRIQGIREERRKRRAERSFTD